ncbi:MAG: NYN domain-containing protein [Phycisphaerae bacterium]
MQKLRVSVYVDGFNLYFGMREARWKECYWLDLVEFGAALLRPNQSLVSVKYFTSRISGPSDKQQRQSLYLQALATRGGVGIYYGQYRSNKQVCRTCGAVAIVPTEKMTDVNIAVEMLLDATKDVYDLAILVSGDSDLTAPIRAVRDNFPEKQVVVAFPPNRSSHSLRAVASACVVIGKSKLRGSQLPDQISTASGFVITKPSEWR